jgi:3-oxoacyl-[acyl-carrier-protein] synthase II
VLFFSNKPHSPPRRVVVTGEGLVTALGAGCAPNIDGFRAGRPAFGPVTLFDVSRQRCKIAAQADFPPDDSEASAATPSGQRATHLLLLAARAAWRQSGWSPSENLPLVLGSTSGEMALGESYLRQALHSPKDNRSQPSRVASYVPHRQALKVCDDLGFLGPVIIIANACASGANAVGHAWEIVRQGRADRVLTGGYDALCDLTFAGFDSLKALSTTVCRPFDAERDGLTLGEGAAILALESLDHARARGAEILGEIIGYGAATDLHHLTQPDPSGRAARLAMERACLAASITPDQVQYVNAHGTATIHNDASEALAINDWAGPSAGALAVSSTKASVGHTLGAAGAIEAVVCLLCLRSQWLPPQTTVARIDPACRFQIVREPTDAPLDIALSNSFGFGGANACLAFRRWS